MQNEEKIRAAIAAYLEKETYFSETLIRDQKTRQFMRINSMQSQHEFCKEIASEIMSTIRPHLQPQDMPCKELFAHMANEHDLILTNTELGDIIHICRK